MMNEVEEGRRDLMCNGDVSSVLYSREEMCYYIVVVNRR